MKISIDTNVLLRFMLGDVENQERLADKLIVNPHHVVGIADATFIELEYALRKHYSFSTSAIADVIEDIMSIRNVNCNRPLLAEVLSVYRHQKGVSFVDICLDTYAHLTEHSPLYTFDKKLARTLPHSKLLA